MNWWQLAFYVALAVVMGVLAHRRSRRAAETPARLTTGEHEALGPMFARVTGLACTAIFGFGALLTLATGKGPWFAVGGILFALLGVWVWGEVGRLKLVWDERGVLRRSALRRDQRFAWDELEAVRVGKLTGGDRLFFSGGRGLNAPYLLTNHAALFAHARAVLDAREAA